MENKIASTLWIYLTLVIVVTGFVGNALTLITMINRHCKKTSFTVILAALAIVDIVVLIGPLCRGWMRYAFDFSVENSGTVWCRLIWYLVYAPAHISVWLVTALTAERTYSVYYPRKVKTVCVVKTGIIVVAIVVAILLVADAHLLFGFTLMENQNTTACTFTNHGYEDFFYQVFTWIDLVIGFIAPAATIFTLNIVTVVRFSNSSVALSEINKDKLRQLLRITSLISMTFIVLYLPGLIYQIIRPHIFETSADNWANETDEVINTVFLNLIYLSHAINFLLYVFSGKRFRNELRNAVCRSSTTVHPKP